MKTNPYIQYRIYLINEQIKQNVRKINNGNKLNLYYKNNNYNNNYNNNTPINCYVVKPNKRLNEMIIPNYQPNKFKKNSNVVKPEENVNNMI